MLNLTGFCEYLCADDLDTRLLRAMVIKGILEQITTANVNLVNADLLAKTRGLRIIESTVPAEGKVSLIFLSILFVLHGSLICKASCCQIILAHSSAAGAS